MKKFLFFVGLIVLLLAGCREDPIEKIYNDFISSDYMKGDISISIAEGKVNLGSVQIENNSMLWTFSSENTSFLYLKNNPENNNIEFYSMGNYTSVTTKEEISSLPLLVTSKEATENGFDVVYDLSQIELIEYLSEATTFTASFSLENNRVVSIEVFFNDLFQMMLGSSDTTLYINNITYGDAVDFAPKILNYTYQDNSEFFSELLANLLPTPEIPEEHYFLVLEKNVLYTKVNEPAKISGYLADATGYYFNVYDIKIDVKDVIDYSIPGVYETTAVTTYKDQVYEYPIYIHVIEPNFMFCVENYHTVELNGTLDIYAYLYDSDLGKIMVPIEISDTYDLTKEGTYQVTVSTTYDNKLYSKEITITVVDSSYYLVIPHEYHFILEKNQTLGDMLGYLESKYWQNPTIYNLPLEIIGEIDYSKVGKYPVTLKTSLNQVVYTKEIVVQIIDSTAVQKETIQFPEKIVEAFTIDDYLVASSKTKLYKYDLKTNHLVGEINLKCQYNHHYFKDSYLYITANYPYESEYLDNNDYSGTVSKIDFSSFELINQVEVDFLPWSIIVDNRGQAIITMGFNQFVDLVSLDFETGKYSKIDSIYMQCELYYDSTLDAFILVYTHLTHDATLYTWDSKTSSYKNESKFEEYVFYQQCQIKSDGLYAFSNDYFNKFTADSFEQRKLKISYYNGDPSYHVIQEDTLYRLQYELMSQRLYLI
ncbi:MAG: hypothetical protein K2J85_06260, partial [Anaeroplasmataceae bacterium]|nr:hypothetical protein [Anaeroplasmataceae bacterium]